MMVHMHCAVGKASDHGAYAVARPHRLETNAAWFGERPRCGVVHHRAFVWRWSYRCDWWRCLKQRRAREDGSHESAAELSAVHAMMRRVC